MTQGNDFRKHIRSTVLVRILVLQSVISHLTHIRCELAIRHHASIRSPKTRNLSQVGPPYVFIFRSGLVVAYPGVTRVIRVCARAWLLKGMGPHATASRKHEEEEQARTLRDAKAGSPGTLEGARQRVLSVRPNCSPAPFPPFSSPLPPRPPAN